MGPRLDREPDIMGFGEECKNWDLNSSHVLIDHNVLIDHKWSNTLHLNISLPQIYVFFPKNLIQYHPQVFPDTDT